MTFYVDCVADVPTIVQPIYDVKSEILLGINLASDKLNGRTLIWTQQNQMVSMELRLSLTHLFYFFNHKFDFVENGCKHEDCNANDETRSPHYRKCQNISDTFASVTYCWIQLSIYSRFLPSFVLCNSRFGRYAYHHSRRQFKIHAKCFSQFHYTELNRISHLVFALLIEFNVKQSKLN